jgi:hypothetical protein
MEEAVGNVVRAFVFHLDEAGASEWEDRTTKRTVVPARSDNSSQSRNLKQVTIVTCMTVSGQHLVP